MKAKHPADKPWHRPKTIAEARDQIKKVFAGCDWDREEQARYLKRFGDDATRLEDLTPDQVRAVQADMEQARMILYEQEKMDL